MARNTPVSLVLLVVLVVLGGVSAQGKGDDLASRISNLVWAQKIGTITDEEVPTCKFSLHISRRYVLLKSATLLYQKPQSLTVCTSPARTIVSVF